MLQPSFPQVLRVEHAMSCKLLSCSGLSWRHRAVMEVYMFEGPINCTMPMHGSFQTGRPLVLSSVLLQVFRFEGTLFSCALYMYSMSGELFSYR